MSRYLVLIYEDEQKWIDGAEGAEQGMADHYRFSVTRKDAVVAGKPLQPTSTATSLRRDGTGPVAITDGPFVETKEALGGFYLVEAADDAEALAIAREVPAPFGGLELRPVQVYGDGPPAAPRDQTEGTNAYVALVYADESADAAMTPAQIDALLLGHGAFQAEHADAVLIGAGLKRTPAARTIQVADGSFAVTDGPFAETKEALGGLYVLQAADLDEAIAIASDIPVPSGGVELRPVMVFG
jgi:hypothetical protein